MVLRARRSIEITNKTHLKVVQDATFYHQFLELFHIFANCPTVSLYCIVKSISLIVILYVLKIRQPLLPGNSVIYQNLKSDH